MKKISLLGATGSIGLQTIDVIDTHPEAFELVAMSFGRNIDQAMTILKKHQPKVIAVQDEEVKKALTDAMYPVKIPIVTGIEGLTEVAVFSDADMVINAVLGSIGLQPTLAAIQSGKTIGIANKETLVTAGHLVMEKAKKSGAVILPVDSEHSAIFQSLEGHRNEDISRLIVTASGGSFRDLSREDLAGVTVEQALNHPNWSMGAKITIDSATLMNKGLEVIEAHWLFGVPYEKIDVVIHRESIIHSLVEYVDNSVIAQLGMPDMKGPIQYAMSYPKRLVLHQAKRLNLWETGTLHFEKANFERFRSLHLAYEAGKAGGTMPTVLNAANEMAVQLFLKGHITFLDIEILVEKALEQHQLISHPDLETILEVDRTTRNWVDLAAVN